MMENSTDLHKNKPREELETTAICTVGDGDNLLYYGYPADELATLCQFEEVAYLLLFGELPNESQLSDFRSRLLTRTLSPGVGIFTDPETLSDEIRDTFHPMDVIHTEISVQGAFVRGLRETEKMPRQFPIFLHPQRKSEIEARFKKDDPRRKIVLWDLPRFALSLLASLPFELYLWRKRLANENPCGTSLALSKESYAHYVLNAVSNEKASAKSVAMMNTSLILYAEHGFNASTHAARTIASTGANMYFAVCGALGALSGELHGGANEQSFRFMQQFATPQEARKETLKALARKEKIMGFGHAVYKKGDPRHSRMKEWARILSREKGDMSLFEIAEAIEEVMREEKGIFPNVDFYTGIAYAHCGIPVEFFTPVFALARLSGWFAHIGEKIMRGGLVRPREAYDGPCARHITVTAVCH
jgi:2-methylcitrate synthase